MNHPQQPRAPVSPASILAQAPPGSVLHHTSFQMQQMSLQRPDGSRFAWWAALWSWTSNDQRNLPAAARVPMDAGLLLRDVQPDFMFDPTLPDGVRLPWQHGQPPPPALLPPQARPALPWWRRIGGTGR